MVQDNSRATFDGHFLAPEFAGFKATLKAEDIRDFDDPADREMRFVEHVCWVHVAWQILGFIRSSFSIDVALAGIVS
jgi:hypothetical protein